MEYLPYQAENRNYGDMCPPLVAGPIYRIVWIVLSVPVSSIGLRILTLIEQARLERADPWCLLGAEICL